MASENDPEPDTADRDDSSIDHNDSDTSSGSESEDPKVEWLATGREKRSTAGNRMQSVLANEEPDSDLELLFAEDANDEGFTDVDGAASDMQMDSSSDEEDDQGRDDDLEGEKELERQARERKAAARKRKAQEAIPAKFRKRVRIDQSTPQPRPKKKSERASWLPSASDAPTRASERKTTKDSKEQLHQQMLEREARRLKQLASMEKKAKRLEALKKPPMTQAERLAEAAIVEKRNAKSLNRWEEAEKQREEERRAKLAALNNRRLDGPVITFWSGLGEWDDGRLKQSGQHVTIEEKPRKKRGIAAQKEKERERLKELEQERERQEAEQKSKDMPGESKPNPEAGERMANDGLDPSTKDDVSQRSIPDNQADVEDEANKEATRTQNDRKDARSTASAGGEVKESPVTPVAPSEVDLSPATSKPELATEIQRKTTTPTAPPPAPKSVLLPANPPEGVPGQDSVKPVTFMAPPVVTRHTSPEVQTDPPQSIASPSAGVPPSVPRPSYSAPSILAPPILAPPLGVAANMLGAGSPTLPSFSPPSNGQKSNVLAPPNTTQRPSPLSIPSARPLGLPRTTSHASTSVSPSSTPRTPTQTSQDARPRGNQPSGDPSHITKPPPNPTKDFDMAQSKATVTRSAIILQNFDELAIKDKVVQTQIIFGRKMSKLPKPPSHPLCAITNHPARYRDPSTGLPYYNMYAYREIKKVCSGEYKWSRILGAWVGSGNLAARGVPPKFLDPNAPRETKPVPPPAPAAPASSAVQAKGPEPAAALRAEKLAQPPARSLAAPLAAVSRPAAASVLPAQTKPAAPAAPTTTAPTTTTPSTPTPSTPSSASLSASVTAPLVPSIPTPVSALAPAPAPTPVPAAATAPKSVVPAPPPVPAVVAPAAQALRDAPTTTQ